MLGSGSCISAVRACSDLAVSVSLCGSEYGVLLCFGSIVKALHASGLSSGILMAVVQDAFKSEGDCGA